MNEKYDIRFWQDNNKLVEEVGHTEETIIEKYRRQMA